MISEKTVSLKFMCSFNLFFFLSNQYLALFDSLMIKQHFPTSEQYNTGNHCVTGLSRHWINRYVHSLNANPHFADIIGFQPQMPRIIKNLTYTSLLRSICLKIFFILFEFPIYSYYLKLPYNKYNTIMTGIYPTLCCT